MKPYILNYSETVAINKRHSVKKQDSTVLTDTVEHCDDDGISMTDVTVVTETIEPSDEDDILSMSTSLISTVGNFNENNIDFTACSTLVTSVIEPSDKDYSTVVTRTLEPADDDTIYN